MAILDDLVSGASGDASVSSLLRLVRVIAARARVPALGEWVDHEQHGYAEGVPLPAYRGPFVFNVVGHLTGLGGELRNAPIGSLRFPEEYRNNLFRVHFRQPIVALERLALASSDLIVRWPADMIGLINGLIRDGRISLYDDFFLLDAWKTVPLTQVVTIVDSVRNRILELALSMQDTDPTLGQVGGHQLPPESSQSFITNIYGSSSNVAIASSDVVQSVQVQRGDKDSLAKSLRSVGVPDEEIRGLFEALAADGLQADPRGTDPSEIGVATSTWFTRLMLGAKELGMGAASGLIARALSQYLGIG